MALTTDIVASYRDPAGVLRRRMGPDKREDRALVTLVVACGLIFVSQWPRLSREAYFEPSIGFDARFGGALLGWIFIAPLLFYGMAGLSHAVARLFGGRGSYYGARMALFWALLAASPLWLLNGLVAGLVGPGPALSAVGLVALAAFLGIWLVGLRAVEKGQGVDA
ncbi:YIP1 family protein [Tranquillimonas alkanivorans]|uniref:Yip1 domain-containing protein n=1 Tax=Tranquillimonas alkanivorans TaxID=441119 RepID=A0A1I5RQI7_9RHOB|nr:YIP1 family protein [Tranquillimonas alkanivorans]SFP60809.1 Yip1 domain-containing protein [Tranquillimonas alkanivorans]